jgi:sugar lactone lactonase YvrE
MAAMLMTGAPPSMAESTATAAVAPPVNTAPPAVSAAVQDPHSLTASIGSWVGAGPLTYSYQWQRCTLGAANSPGSGPGQLVTPEGIAVDPHADVWISDTYHGRLEEFSAAGKFLKTVGTRGPGPGQIGEPEGIAIDPKGDVWVADWRNNTIDVFKEDGEYLRQFGGQGSGDGQLYNPYSVAIDAQGHVWVGDVGNNRVEEFTEDGGYVSQFGSRGSGAGQFGLSYPIGLAVDAKGHLWLTDTENNRLEEFNEAGEYLWQLGPYWYGSGGAAAGVAVGPNGFWVVDSGDARLTQFNRYGGYERQFGSPGVGAGQLNRPGGLAVGPNGEVWVIDTGNNRLAEFSEEGAVIQQTTCVSIPGATSASYTTGVADLGSDVQVVVTATNGAGSASAAGPASSTTGPPAEPPTATSTPNITGTAQEGQTLTVSTGSWTGSPTSYAFQWEDCDALGEGCLGIAGATGSSYALTASDVGHTVRVLVTASNAGGSTRASSATTATVVPTAPLNLALPSIGGSAVEGQTLTVSAGTWTGSPTSYAFQWEDCDALGEGCLSIAGATWSSYALTASDVGHTVRVLVTASNAGGSTRASSATTATVVPTAPLNSALPSIGGSAVEGQTLTVSAGIWTGSPTSYAFQWEDCDALGQGCLSIAGATGSSYTLTASDVGHTVRVLVTASNAAGSSQASSATGALPIAAPSAQPGAPSFSFPTFPGNGNATGSNRGEVTNIGEFTEVYNGPTEGKNPEDASWVTAPDREQPASPYHSASLRLECKENDWINNSHARQRVQVEASERHEYGAVGDMWMSLGIMLQKAGPGEFSTEGNQEENQILMELYPYGGDTGYANLALEVVEGKWYLTVRGGKWETGPPAKPEHSAKIGIESNLIQRGVWNEFLIYQKLSTEKSVGETKLWHRLHGEAWPSAPQVNEPGATVQKKEVKTGEGEIEGKGYPSLMIYRQSRKVPEVTYLGGELIRPTRAGAEKLFEPGS